MAIIPRVAPTVREISPLARVRNDARRIDTPDLSGAVANVIRTTQEVYQHHKERADTTALLQARKALGDHERALFDPANPEGLASFKGKDALQAGEKLGAGFEAKASEIGASLTPDQRQRFDVIAMSARESVLGRIQTYAGTEYEQWQTTERKSAIGGLVDNAVAVTLSGDQAAGDRGLAEALAMQAAADRSDGFGEGTATFRNNQKAAVSAFRESVVHGLMARDYRQAMTYLHAHGDEMLPESRTRIEAQLLPIAEDGDIDDAAEAAIAGVPGAVRPSKPRGEPAPAVRSAIEAAAQEYGVPVEDLMALAEQESGFNPKARNKQALDDGDHAEGLFQFRATTASRYGVSDRTDVVQSARAAARMYREHMDKGGRDFAIAAHFAGEGGAEAVVKRGEVARNPKTAAYLEEVRGRRARWAGGMTAPSSGKAPAAAGAVDEKPDAQVVTFTPPQTEGEALARLEADPRLVGDPRRMRAAQARVREKWSQREQDEADRDRAAGESINLAVWQAADPRQSLPQILGPERYAFAARKGWLGGLAEALRFRREGDPTRTDNPAVVGAYLSTFRESPEAFAKMDVTRNLRHMSKDTGEELLQLQAQVRAGKFKPDDYATESEQLRALVYVPMGAEGESEAAKKKRAGFEAAWFSAKREYVKRMGKEPNAEQREGLIKRLVTAHALAGTPFMDDPNGGQVPDEHRAQIVAAFTKAGKPAPDEATIRRLYLLNAGAQ